MTKQPSIIEALRQMERGNVEASPRWVRVRQGDTLIADSHAPLLLVQFGPHVMPTYFFKLDEVDMSLLGTPVEQDNRRIWPVRVNGETIENGAWTYINPSDHLAELANRITFVWNGLLDWYEEAEQVYVHARDPHKRVDTVASSRHVQIRVNGEVIADTHDPYLLFETFLPTRYYIPREDVKMVYLTGTDHVSMCPYKGTARYWSIEAGGETLDNVVWSYPDPVIECPKIKDLLCFYNEKVDVYVDGELQPRPQTPWS